MLEKNIPEHVAIIPDGNRRWAKRKGMPGVKGHEDSTKPERIKSLIKKADELKIKYLSFWGFSTENWKRSKLERNFLFKLVKKTISDLIEFMLENKIKFRHIGRKDRLPKDLADKLEELEEKTKNNLGINVQILLDYGGRDEILRAVKKAKQEEEITEEKFSKLLDTNGIPDPELIIRTGGEKRLSGFLLFQCAYSELFFSDKYFPDFSIEDFTKAVNYFSNIQRRFGGD